MREFTFENQTLGSFLVYRPAPEEELDRTALGMLTYNEIPGLLPVSCLHVDMDQIVRFKISSLTALMGWWTGPIRRQKLLTFLTSVCRTVLECQEYMLDPEKLLLRWDYVFVEPLSGEARLAYLPVTGEGESSLVDFLRELVQRTTFDPQEDGSHVAVLFNALNAPNFSAEGFYKELQSLQGTAKPQAAAPARPIEEAAPLPVQQAPKAASIPTVPPRTPQTPPQMAVPPVPQAAPPVQAPPMQQMPVPPQKPGKAPKPPKAPKAPKGAPQQNFGFAVPGMTPPPQGVPGGMAVPPMPVPPAAAPVPPQEEKKKKGFLGFGKKKEAPIPPAAAAPIPPAPPVQQPISPARPVQQPMQQPAPAAPGGGGRTVPLGGGQAAGRTVPFGQGEDPTAGMSGVGKLYLVRRLNGQRAAIDKDVFHVGREQRIVDFCLTGGRNWVGTDHAYFLRKEDGYYLVDNNSMNHTWLNGQQLVSNHPYPVKAGDVVRMADEEFDLLGG